MLCSKVSLSRHLTNTSLLPVHGTEIEEMVSVSESDEVLMSEKQSLRLPDAEQQSLLEPLKGGDDGTPEIQSLRYVDVPRTAERILKAARPTDYLHHYLYDTPDADKNPIVPNYRSRTLLYLRWTNGIRRREMLTINRGDSILLYSSAPSSLSRRKRTVEELVRAVIVRIDGLFGAFYTAEQHKRAEELRKASSAAIADALGHRLEELISLDNLATATEKQGLGYASLLVNHVLSLGRAQSRGVWLLTNEHTVGFYERFGFRLAGTYTLGEHNPTWTEEPIIMCILLWEPTPVSDSGFTLSLKTL